MQLSIWIASLITFFDIGTCPFFHSMKVYHKEGKKKIMTIIRYSYATQHLVCDKIVQDRNHEYKKVQGRKI